VAAVAVPTDDQVVLDRVLRTVSDRPVADTTVPDVTKKHEAVPVVVLLAVTAADRLLLASDVVLAASDRAR
jgi:hypothetical protein